MIFENALKSIFAFLMANNIIRYFVYDNYNSFESVELMKLTVLKYSLILPIIALIYEVGVFLKNSKAYNYDRRKLKKRIFKINDPTQIKTSLVTNGIFILGILVFYLINKSEESGQYLFYLILLNFITIEFYFIFNNLNNIKIRNGIYEKGIFFMGKSYKWQKIKDLKVKKEKNEIYIIREIPFLGNIKTKIKYTNEKILKYVDEIKSEGFK